MRRSSILRAVALLLAALSLGWLVLAVIEGYLPEADTPPMMILYASLVLIPPFSFLLLLLLLRWLVHTVEPPADQRLRIRLAVWTTGPFGCIWAIFRLTSEFK